MRRIALLALAMLSPFAANAQCAGQDLIAALPAAEIAPLRAAADAVPFAVGNFWRARKDGEEVTLIGTLHLDDPRFDGLVAQLSPFVTQADLLLVEAGPAEQAALKSAMAKDPSLLVNTAGPTLPELLPDDDWQALSAAMTARGVPGFMAAKFKPWYVSMLLSLPPCAMAGGPPNGLDQRLIAAAAADGIAVKGLEPFDTAFKVLQFGTLDQQIAMLKSALSAEPMADDMTATLIGSYFAQDARMSWEFTKGFAKSLPEYDSAEAEFEFSLMEDQLMTARNEAWIPVIEAALAAQDGPVVVAFGALHLAGDRGVLNLLAERGFVVERIDLP